MSGVRGLVALCALWLLAWALCGCVTRDGPVTIARSLSLGVWRGCLSDGVGVQLCEHVRFDPASCAIVVIYPKPPSPGLRAALERLAQPTQALCAGKTEGTSPDAEVPLSTARDR